MVATAANVADSQVLPDLLHGEETRVMIFSIAWIGAHRLVHLTHVQPADV